jgi:hypothetical protein
MKKLFAVLLTAALIPAVAFAADLVYVNPTTGALVRAEVSKPGGASDTGALRVSRKYVLLYDSGDVAAGALINSGDLDTSNVSEVTVVCLNAHTALRVLTINFKTADGNAIYFPTGNCALSARTAFAIAPGTPSTAGFGYGVPAKMSFSLAALGAANGRVWVYGR